MRDHSYNRRCGQKRTLLAAAALLMGASLGPILLAQCTMTDDSSAPGCATQTQEPDEQQSAPEDLSIPATTQDGLRSPRQSNPMTNGPTFEDRAQIGRGRLQELRQLAPEPLTEFQRLVAATTGEVIPIFGSDLFANRPISFTPLEAMPAPATMVIGPGDELRIRIWGQVNFNANLTVDRNGEIYLPKAGAVHVAGLPFSELAAHLRASLGRVFRNFDLSADLGQIHSIQIYVTGEARHPGLYTVSALSTLVDAAFASGGPSAAGSMRHVELKRGERTMADFDLYALMARGDKTGDMQLEAGDILYFPPVGAEVALLGSVRQKGIYELRGEETVGQLLATAGGRTALASRTPIHVERVLDHDRRTTLLVASDGDGMATRLADGDIVRVDSIASSYLDTVTLRGSVAHAGRYRWHEGMRLSEILPDRAAVLSRAYEWERTKLGVPSQEFEPAVAALRPPTGNAMQADKSESGTANRQNVESSSAQSTAPAGESFVAPAMRSQPQNAPPSALGALGESNGNESQRVEWEAALLRPADETDWNYAVIERVDRATMRTSLIPFDLGKLVLDHDKSQDLALRPGDVVTIFSQNDLRMPVDEQTKYVRLEGEFVHPGIYSVEPRETLRSLVERAGGLTRNAYLYGSVFTRESTRLTEQKRMNDYAEQIEHQLARNETASPDSIGGDAQEQVQSRDETVDRLLLTQLRRAKATGRVVLNLPPEAQGSAHLPAMALEDGDRMVVPATPATVQVIGAVANQNAFLYREGGTVREYLNLAGNLTRDADRHQIFVLRADGSVDGRGNGGLLSSPVGKLRLHPGDTVVVPEKKVGAGALRGIVNWTQLISGLALGAAAINAIR
jgi:protein involved in polysaccharide export with SLBB domain